MTDYNKLGLKVGLEIHQQLNTNKLFCRCPSVIRDDDSDKTVKRMLRAVSGETGSTDIAAKHEAEKKKVYQYEAYADTTCLVELDEEPPHPLNEDALKIVLQLSKMMHCNVVDQIHVMRKTVVDGSNTSGFQRTALIARNGSIDVESSNTSIANTSGGETYPIGIETLCLEEDAARIISRTADADIYRLDRLGIPLIEIATAPDMHTPQQVKETAAFIGMMLRSTGKVKRGLGTIRQDVNVSIFGGARVEIKGVQDLRLIDTVVEYEVLRQQNMQALRTEMLKRGIDESVVDGGVVDFTDDFKTVEKGFLRKALDAGQQVYGKVYRSMKGFFGYEVNPDRRFGSELSDRIKVLGLNGLIHTDENLEKYGIAREVSAIFKQHTLEAMDGMIFIIGSEERCALAFARIDAALTDFLLHGLSKEVRNAKEDGTSAYLRPMPGSARMYPETDIPTITPGSIRVEAVELIKDKIARFEKQHALPKQVARELVLEPLFENYAYKYPTLKTILIAESLTSYPKEIKTLHGIELDVGVYLDTIFMNVSSGDLDPSSVKEVLIAIAKGSSVEAALSRFKKADESELVEFITGLIAKHPGLTVQALMGETMKHYRGKFSGQRIMELIKQFKGE